MAQVWLSLVFFLSGFSALMYQVAWQRLLTVYYGVGAVSTALIVSIYMAGLGLGSLFGGRLAETSRNKLRVYFIIELAIGVFGAASVVSLDFLGKSTAGSSYVTTFLYMSLFLLIPTFLMGATLPILTKIFNQYIRDFLNTVSFLYFINTIGAAVGALFGSFVVASFWGLDCTVYAAAGINVGLALIILWVARQEREPQDHVEKSEDVDSSNRLGRAAYALVFVTGFLAIGYEVVWFRVLGVLLRASVYVFSSILFVYLTGIALGSYWMGRRLRSSQPVDRKRLFFLLQVILATTVAGTFIVYYWLTRYTDFFELTKMTFNITTHPLWSPNLDVRLETVRDWVYLIIGRVGIFIWPAFFMLLPSWIMGATFPLISWLAMTDSNREGRTVGQVYFFNILGNVAGGLVTGFVLLPFLGTENTILAFIVVGLVFGLGIRNIFSFRPTPLMRVALILIFMASIAAAFPRKHMLYDLIHIHWKSQDRYSRYYEEGVDGVVGTFLKGGGVNNYINGSSHGGRPGFGFYSQAIDSLSYTKNPKDVLVIGYGTGSTVEAILKSTKVQNLTLVELNRTLMRNLQKIELFQELLSDPRLNIVIEDGRRYLLRANKTYDLIVIDPLLTKAAYSNNLYSKEFYEIVKDHLNPGGIFHVWTDERQVMPRTVAEVFEHVMFFNIRRTGFCVASQQPLEVDRAEKIRLVMAFPKDMREILKVSFTPAVARREDILRKMDGIPINTDWRPRCEYFLGLIYNKTYVAGGRGLTGRGADR